MQRVKALSINRPGSARADEGRIAKKRRETRARLLKAAYEVISESGIDAAKLQDITDRADVGFGTVYNYFDTKDKIAEQVLDCVIYDLGQRNVVACQGLHDRDPALVMPVSIRLVLREAMTSPMWRWWALRPDLLATRMRDGFKPFAMRDMREAIGRGIFELRDEDVEAAWTLAVWMMVGGIHDVVVGSAPLASECFVVESIMRVMGVSLDLARRISRSKLPKFPPPRLDWTFELASAATR